MLKAGEVHENPVTGERAVIRTGTDITDGQLLNVDLCVKPGGAAMGEHLHPGHMPQRTIGLRVDPSAETIHVGQLTVRFLLTGDDSAGSIAAFELFVPGAQRLAAPAHSHDHYEETIYGVDGVLTWTVDGSQVAVGPGQSLCIPRGAIHRFDNNGAGSVRALCLITPAAIGPQYFREAADVINAAAGGPPDRVKMTEIMIRHGLTPAPPPPQA